MESRLNQTDEQTSPCLVCKVSLEKAVSDWIPTFSPPPTSLSVLHPLLPPPSPSSTFTFSFLSFLHPYNSATHALTLLHLISPPPFTSTFTLLPSSLPSHLPTIAIYFLQPHPYPPSISSTLYLLHHHPLSPPPSYLLLHPHSPASQIFSVRLFLPSARKRKTLGSNQICVMESRRLCGGARTERR